MLSVKDYGSLHSPRKQVRGKDGTSKPPLDSSDLFLSPPVGQDCFGLITSNSLFRLNSMWAILLEINEKLLVLHISVPREIRKYPTDLEAFGATQLSFTSA